jgi:uncharacterized membrane protein YfcA
VADDKFKIDWDEFGAPQVAEEPSTPSLDFVAQARPQRTGAKALKVVFAILGLAGGVLGAFYAYRISSSWFLVVYAFFLVQWLIGRGFGQIFTEPYKVQRFFYYVIPVLTSTGSLYLAQRLWDKWWLSVVLSVFVGGLIGIIAVTLIFPRIAKQETQDSTSRTKAQFGL